MKTVQVYNFFIWCGILNYSESILGGYEIIITEAPHHVGYGEVCGGVLLHQKWTVTAAHCGTNWFYIRIGSTYREMGFKFTIKYHLLHPRYQEDHEYDFDVQLLYLWKPVQFSSKVAALPLRSYSMQVGDNFTVTGWGYSKEWGEYAKTLNQVVLRYIPLSECQKVDQPWYNYSLTDRMFCATGDDGQDACQGDSGGGAVSSGHLVGLSSFGYGCGRVPDVYSNFSHPDIMEWLIKNVN